MSVPNAVRTEGGPWDLVIRNGNSVMGFITQNPVEIQQVSNVAPNFSTGGDSHFASDAFSQIVMKGFEIGGDREIFEQDDLRYQWQDGKMALHIPGRATLASQWSSVDAGIAPVFRRIIDFIPSHTNFWVVLAESDSLRVMNTNTEVWSSAGTFGNSPSYIFATDQYLFVAFGPSADAVKWDGLGTAAGNFTTMLAGKKATCFGFYQQTLYRSLGNKIEAATSNDGSGWSGTEIKVGWDGTNITDIYEAAGYLVICKPEGLFVYDGSEVYRTIDAHTFRTTTNFVGGTEFHGALYAPIMNGVHKAVITSVRSAVLSNATPRMVGSADKERYGHGTPMAIVSTPDYIYTAFNGGENVYPEVLSYNEFAWHQVYRGTSGDTMAAIGYSRLMGWLIINDGATRRKRLLNAGWSEYPDFATSGQFTTPGLDGGFPTENKIWHSISTKVRGLSSTRTITVDYLLDGTLGTISEVLNANPVNPSEPIEMTFGGAQGQVTGKKLEIRFTFTRDPDDVTVSPEIIGPVIVRGLPRPKALNAGSAVLILDEAHPLRGPYENHTLADAYTLNEAIAFLKNCADSATTLVIIDEWGRRYRAVMTNKGESSRRKAGETEEREDRKVGIKWMEVVSGVSAQQAAPLVINATTSTELLTSEDYQYTGLMYTGIGFTGTGEG
jgi:hypothetical protein